MPPANYIAVSQRAGVSGRGGGGGRKAGKGVGEMRAGPVLLKVCEPQ